MCNILGANFLHNEQSIMCDKEVLKSLTTKMLHISLQRAEEVFPALKDSSVCCTDNQFISLCCCVCIILFTVHKLHKDN